MYRYLLFDLDGTLTDPKVGICTCVQYALGKMGIVEEDLDKLEVFIGPPLLDSFKEYYGLSDEKCSEAIAFYRERFADVGKFENEVYPGIPELLRDLKKKGRTLAIASSKPTIFVEQILEHFEIKQYFDVIVGSEEDGRRSKKIEVIEEALRQLFTDTEPEYDEVVMIGDRKFDIEASLEAGVRNIGVSYGYGSREELETAGADKIVNTVAGLRAALLPMVGEDSRAYQMRTQNVAQGQSSDNASGPKDYKEMAKESNRKSFVNMWGMIGPVATYKIGAYAGMFMLWTFTILVLGPELVEPMTNPLVATYTALGAVLLCAFLVKSFIRLEKKEKEKEQPKLLFRLEPLAYGISIALMAMGLNGLAQISASQAALNASNIAAEAQDVADAAMQMGPSLAEMKASLPLIVILLLYGIAMPCVEQFIYTGFSYRRANRFMQPAFSYVVIIFLFAFTKNYTIAGIGGFAVYAATLYAFTRYPKIWYAMLVHSIASVLVQLQDYCEPFNKIFEIRALNSILSALGLTGVCILVFMANKANKKETA